ncbi:hypothetical protein L484_003610 [Morus notabilis]|uniref:Uncharacterized protein n=2 Tax=Morus notabilis TaxID=981085 RepID=W9S501_9ROSA|nr:hypothetical protein L484_003610 [Morus notabilis]
MAITNLQQEMKTIEDKRQDVKRNITKLNEELERLTGTALSSNEQLDPSHLLTKFNQRILERTSKTAEVTAASLSRIPRFMKPTVCSRGKSGADYQTYQVKVKFPTRRRASSHRAESVNFPVKRTSEKNSECSISRNSCLVDLNVESNADDETEYSQDATECEIKNVIFSEQETTSKSPVQKRDNPANSDRHGKGKKTSSSSTNLLKVDNWLRLHKSEPTTTLSNFSHKSKRVLAIPIPEKKQTNKNEKEDDLPNGNDNKYTVTKKKIVDNEKLENCAVIAGFGRSKHDIESHIDGFINRDSSCGLICSLDKFDEETILCKGSLIDNGLPEENNCGSSSPPEIWCTSLNLDQDGNQVNKIFVMQEEKARKQCTDSISQDNNAFSEFSLSDGMPPDNEQCELSPFKVAHSMFDTKEDSGSEIGMDDSENEDADTVDQCSGIGFRPGIHNISTQRALFLGHENPTEPLMTLVKSQENTENSGICQLLMGKVHIFGASALLALGFQNLGLEDEFFQGLIL